MKKTGIVLLIIGIIGLLIFGIQTVQQPETFSFSGINIGVSQVYWIPIIISVIIFVIGVVLLSLKKRAPAYNRRKFNKYSIS
jgi:Mn2+/Fe2+ NRAMP family transporter